MNARRSCYIVGAGGHARVVLSILAAAEHKRPVEVLGFLSEREEERGRMVDGLPVRGGLSLIFDSPPPNPRPAAIVAIGDNRARSRVFDDLRRQGVPMLKAIHPSAVIDPQATLGDGTVVAAGAIVNVGAEIGADTIVNTGASVDHDCRVGEHVHLAPGSVLAGGVTVGDRALVGVGASVIPGVTIGADVVVGAGSVVIRDVPDGVTVAGVPAAPIRHRERRPTP